MSKYLLKTGDGYCLRQGQKYYTWDFTEQKIISDILRCIEGTYHHSDFCVWHKRHAKYLFKHKENCVPKALRELRRLCRNHQNTITISREKIFKVEKKIKRLKSSMKN